MELVDRFDQVLQASTEPVEAPMVSAWRSRIHPLLAHPHEGLIAAAAERYTDAAKRAKAMATRLIEDHRPPAHAASQQGREPEPTGPKACGDLLV